MKTAIILLSLFSKDAFAYIDPGSGSLIIQIIIGFFALLGTIYYSIKMKISSFFKKIFKKNKKID